MSQVLIDRLYSQMGYPKITAHNHDDFIFHRLIPDSTKRNDADANQSEAPKTAILFLTGNVERTPETSDVAVVLPELVSHFGLQLDAGVVEESDERELPTQYEVSAHPALVFIREGVVIGSICRIKDWQDYLIEIQNILNKHSHISNVIPTTIKESDYGC